MPWNVSQKSFLFLIKLISGPTATTDSTKPPVKVKKFKVKRPVEGQSSNEEKLPRRTRSMKVKKVSLLPLR